MISDGVAEAAGLDSWDCEVVGMVRAGEASSPSLDLREEGEAVRTVVPEDIVAIGDIVAAENIVVPVDIGPLVDTADTAALAALGSFEGLVAQAWVEVRIQLV